MNEPSTTTTWPEAVQGFLSDLVAVQSDFSAMLSEHRQGLVVPGGDEPITATPAAQSLLQRLDQCYRRRTDLLKAASRAGSPAPTLRAAVTALSDVSTRRLLQTMLDEAESAGRRLRLAGLTHWMLAQRSLAHVSQLLEILATGAPQPPTYGNGAVWTPRGGLLDEAA